MDRGRGAGIRDTPDRVPWCIRLQDVTEEKLMDAIADWLAARAVLIGALAIVVYVLIPAKKFKRGARHYWMEDQHK